MYEASGSRKWTLSHDLMPRTPAVPDPMSTPAPHTHSSVARTLDSVSRECPRLHLLTILALREGGVCTGKFQKGVLPEWLWCCEVLKCRTEPVRDNPAYVTTPQTHPRTELEGMTTRLRMPSLSVNNIILEHGGYSGTLRNGTRRIAKSIGSQ